MGTRKPMKARIDKEKIESLKESHETVLQEKADTETTETQNVSASNTTGILSESPTEEQKGRKTRSDKGRPRGPRGSKRDVDVSQFLPESMVQIVISAPYSLMANRRGEHWRLSDEEVKSMMPVHQAVLQKYLPEYISKHAELYSLFTLHGLAIWMRLEFEQRLKQRDKENAERLGEISTPGGGDSPSHSPTSVDSENSKGNSRFGAVERTSKTTGFSEIGRKSEPDSIK